MNDALAQKIMSAAFADEIEKLAYQRDYEMELYCRETFYDWDDLNFEKQANIKKFLTDRVALPLARAGDQLTAPIQRFFNIGMKSGGKPPLGVRATEALKSKKRVSRLDQIAAERQAATGGGSASAAPTSRPKAPVSRGGTGYTASFDRAAAERTGRLGNWQGASSYGAVKGTTGASGGTELKPWMKGYTGP